MIDPAGVHPALRPLLDGDGSAPIADLPAARAHRARTARERGGPSLPMRRVGDLTDPVRLRWYEPERRTGPGALVVVHGGGWVWGGIEESDPLARALADATGRLTVLVGYRLAPESRYPAALDDVCAAIEWLATVPDVDAQDVVLLGMSAGGNLAAAASSRLRGTQSQVAAQVLVYPMLDPVLGSESARRYADASPLSRARAAWFWDQYAPGATRLAPGAVPPLASDVGGLPPTRVVLADVDVLRDEGLAYAEQLRSAGIRADSTVWPGTVHGFLAMAGLVPEICAAAIADIAEWIGALRSETATP